MFDNTMCRQMTDFQKATVDNTFAAMDKMQEQGESLLNVFFNQAAWMPEEGKKMFREWNTGCRTARNEYRKMVGESFKVFDNLTDTFPSSKKTTARAKKA